MFRLLSVLTTLLLTINTTFACSCFGEYDFCSTMATAYNEPDVIIKAKKVQDIAHGMDVEVLEVIKGEEQRATVRVWGDNGILCRVYTEGFGIGQELVLALYKIGDFSWEPIEQEDDYQLSICGVYFLPINDGNVLGSIAPGIASMPYSDFPEFATSCLVSSSVHPNIPGKQLAEVYPNPVQDELTVSFGELVVNPVLQLYDISGRLMVDSHPQLNAKGGEVNLDAGNLAPGIYILSIQDKAIRQTRKIVVSR